MPHLNERNDNVIIGIHDNEQDTLRRKTFPNYALMKISAFHKKIGDTVEWWKPFGKYDKVYSSKIFDFTPENPYLPPDTIKGGTGYNIHTTLPPEIETIYPDYSIYPDCDYAIGYITRGCPNNCRWCIVPQKEGNIKPYRKWQELVRPDSKKLVLMDNNILASEYGIEQLRELSTTDYQIDLNQGMDSRLVTDEIAYILSKIKWVRFIRFSCDTSSQIEPVLKTAKLLQKYGVKPYRLFIYLLVTKDINNAAHRVEQLKQLKGITIYAQAERNESQGIVPNKLQLEFAQRYIYSGKYRKETWSEYCNRLNISTEENTEMARIDFNARKRQQLEQEVHTADEQQSELSKAYIDMWGSSKEAIEYIEVNMLKPYEQNDEKQPFKLDRDKIESIKLSAADIGIITPLTVRKRNGEYQIIAGHHRAVAAQELNILSVPCVVKNISDEEAYQYVIESNIQRMKMLPTEYGKIFRCYLERRKDIDMTAQEIADKFGISKRSMFRYEKVTSLIPELQEYADTELINIDSVENLVKFSEDNQRVVCEFLERTERKHKVTASLSKKMAAIVENYGGDTVPVHEFTALVIKPTADKSAKRVYKNAVYNSVAQKYKIDCSEKELDSIVAAFLEDYFKNKEVV